MTSIATLRSKLLDPRQFVQLYGTTPPRATSTSDRIMTAATKLAERVQALPLDGVVVYDIQDESSRTNEPRPFPFLPTIEARSYGHLLQEMIGKPAITYKCIAEMTEDRWDEWLYETSTQYGVQFLSLVGLPSSRGRHSTMSLPHATQIAATHESGFTLGGVVIAERHSPARSESQRILQKAADGCQYFISQAVYHADTSIRFLNDYANECHHHTCPPQRIVLTFTPCGRPQTMTFLKWLGISIDSDTEHSILSSPAPLSTSIRFCCDTFRAILDQPFVESVPLGINVESVSINKDEIEASIELSHALREVARERGLVGA
jgi:hypothetical protein